MNLTTLLKPLTPAVETARHYSVRKLRRDLLAGLTVSVVEVPQAMAYALIAGVPPVYGLYTSILQGVIGALLSSSEHMTTGPTNTQSLLIASAVKTVALPLVVPVDYLHLVFGLTLLKGLIQLAFAAARLGDLVRYVSRSVIVGLVAGAGMLIIVGQLPSFLGVDLAQATTRLPDPLSRIDVLSRLDRTLQLAGDANWRALLIGCIVIAVILVMRAISRLLPGALTGVVAAGMIVVAAGWSSGDQLRLIDRLPEGLPHPINPWPGLDYARELLPGALALAILGMLESVAIAKSLAARTGERISANQEFFAQGLTNTLAGFFQCIPGSGSFTRSALDYEAGAATRFAAVFNAVFVAIIFLLLADWARFIPLASLAGVLFVIAFGLIDWRQIVQIVRTDRSDAIVCIITFASTLLVPLEYAIFIGIFLNLTLYLRVASRLHLAEMVQTPGGGQFIEMPLRDRTGHRQVMFLQIEGDLFFGVADELQDQLRGLTQSGVRVVILRLRRTHSVDSTILHVLEQFTLDLQRRGGHVILCGVRPEIAGALRAYGLEALIGKQNIFAPGGRIFSSAKQALQRAKELVGSSIDAPAVALEEKDEIVYEI